jgi:hypothetical protein
MFDHAIRNNRNGFVSSAPPRRRRAVSSTTAIRNNRNGFVSLLRTKDRSAALRAESSSHLVQTTIGFVAHVP